MMRDFMSNKQFIFENHDRNTNGFESVDSILPRVLEIITDVANSRNGITGLSTGFKDLDSAIAGIHETDLIIIGARPGMGRTSFALNIALHVAKTSKKTIAVFSPKIPREQLVTRLIVSESMIDMRKLKIGLMTTEEWHKLADTTALLSTLDVLINDDAVMTFSSIADRCRDVQNLGLIIIDDTHLIQPEADGQIFTYNGQVLETAEIGLMMKVLAKELCVPVICTSNVSRTLEERKDKRPILSDFREFGAIDKYADIVIGLYRDYYYDNNNPECENYADCLILRNRRGEAEIIPLFWTPEYARFSPFDRYYY